MQEDTSTAHRHCAGFPVAVGEGSLNSEGPVRPGNEAAAIGLVRGRRPINASNCHGSEFTREKESDQWWDDYDWADQPLRFERFKRFTRRWRQAQSPGQLVYWKNRANAQRRTMKQRVDTCSDVLITVECDCGPRTLPQGCRQRLTCERCRRRFYGRIQRRALRALCYEAAKFRGDCRGGGWRFFTLTRDHEGELDARRASLQTGHERLRKWLWKRCGKYPYFAAWETTEGRDGRGHLHVHVIAWLPYVDYNAVKAEWKRATAEPGNADGPCTHLRGWIDIQGIDGGAEGAAHYIAKYATKGFSTDADGAFPPELAAHVNDVFYQRRLYTASRGFWVRDVGCEECLQAVRLIEVERVHKPLPQLLNVSLLQPRAIGPPSIDDRLLG